MKRLVIVHPEMGIYLGNFMGLGFWSKLDPVGQPSAITFATESEAKEHMEEALGVPLPTFAYHEVEADEYVRHGLWFASITACVKAGLPGWSTGFTDHNPNLHPDTETKGPMQ